MPIMTNYKLNLLSKKIKIIKKGAKRKRNKSSVFKVIAEREIIIKIGLNASFPNQKQEGERAYPRIFYIF
jgi:hypothetical protein